MSLLAVEIHPALLCQKLREISGATDSLHQHIIIEAKSGGLIMQGANLYIELATCLISCTVHSTGMVGIEHQSFLRIINAVKTGNNSIKLTQVGNDLVIETKTGRYPIPTKPTKEIPVRLEGTIGDKLFTAKVKAQDLKSALEVCSKTAPTQDAQAALNSIQLSITEGRPDKMMLVGLERARMNISNVALEEHMTGKHGDVLIPMHSTVPHLMRNLNGDGVVTIEAECACVVITLPSGEVVTSKVLEANKYPNWRAILKDPYFKQIEVEKSQFLSVLTMMQAYSTNRFQKVLLSCKQGQLSVSQKEDAWGNEAGETIQVSQLGADFDLSYQVHYLVDCIHVARHDSTIRMAFSESGLLQITSSCGKNLGIVSSCRV
ncbi:hypothetical protein [Vibrio agarivorans]|uniref:Beta sliding clamp n=1 Tax=Vibrio agarivorans TaxID=153622 RepID=A0ABT7Y7D3_9VIBR|nr:hypothetical protein [Vibrio agarivorans]MDN2483953.1 hypothetical protein [Vibrio agarivorans]